MSLMNIVLLTANIDILLVFHVIVFVHDLQQTVNFLFTILFAIKTTDKFKENESKVVSALADDNNVFHDLPQSSSNNANQKLFNLQCLRMYDRKVEGEDWFWLLSSPELIKFHLLPTPWRKEKMKKRIMGKVKAIGSKLKTRDLPSHLELKKSCLQTKQTQQASSSQFSQMSSISNSQSPSLEEKWEYVAVPAKLDNTSSSSSSSSSGSSSSGGGGSADGSGPIGNDIDDEEFVVDSSSDSESSSDGKGGSDKSGEESEEEEEEEEESGSDEEEESGSDEEEDDDQDGDASALCGKKRGLQGKKHAANWPSQDSEANSPTKSSRTNNSSNSSSTDSADD